MFGDIIPRRINVYRVPSNFLNLRVAILLLVIDACIGTCGYMIIEGFRFVDAIYMVVITISTVGYTEVQSLTVTGKIFSSIYIVLNIGIFAYILAVFSYYIIQGEIFKKMHTDLINKSIAKLSGHIIICGYGKYGREIAFHFMKHQTPFVIIDIDPEKIELIQKSEERMLYIQDDATHDEALQEANIANAQALISAMPDDADNVFTVLTARQLNPKISIISRANNPKSQKKLLLAGASHVIMPEQIGGFYMATLVTKPDAVEFFSFITNEYRSDIGFEEITFEDVPARCKNLSIRDMHIRQQTGLNIIGYKDAKNHYTVNPAPDTILEPNTSFIVLGNREQLNRLKDFLAQA